MTDLVKKLEDDARTAITEISTGDLHRMLEEGENFVLIDVREENEYEAGHIEGAILIPRGTAEWTLAENFTNPDVPLVFYCRTGVRSALVTKMASEIGFRNVRNLKGSIKEWLEGGHEVYSRLGSLNLSSEGFEKKDR